MASPKHPHKTRAQIKAQKSVKRASRQRHAARVRAARVAAPVFTPAPAQSVSIPLIPPVEKLGFFAMLGAFLGLKRSKKERRQDPKGDKPAK